MIELELASARHQIFALQLELLVERIEAVAYDPAAVGDERACALGKWLYGPGRALAHLSPHAELERTHRHFHEQAGRMVRLFNAGDHAAAMAILAGSFAEASRDVNAAIAQLKTASRAERERQSSQPGDDRALRSDPALQTGIGLIDTQHKEIAAILDRLIGRCREHLDAAAVSDMLGELCTLIGLHFDSEELFMRHAGVPAEDVEAHCLDHARLLRDYKSIAANPGPSVATVPCAAVEQWMVEHIRAHDLALAAYAHVPFPLDPDFTCVGPVPPPSS